MARKTAKNLAEPFCVEVIHVHALNHRVFENHAPSRFFEIVFRGFYDFRDRILVRDRHYLAPRLVVACVKRESKSYGKPVVGKTIHVFDESARRKRYVALGHVESLLGRKQTYEFRNFVVVIERFAAAHKHDVSYGSRFGVAACLAVYAKHLRENLSRRKITDESAYPRRTESAPHTAPHLRGNAKRIAVRLLHKRAFDNIAVGKAIKIFFRSVARNEFLFDSDPARGVKRFEFFAESGGKIAHFVVLVKARDMGVKLFCPVRRNAEIRREFFDFFVR